MAQQPSNMPAVPSPTRTTGAVIPDRLYIKAPEYNDRQCEYLAKQAAAFTRAIAPKLSGRGAAGIKPYWGRGFFGIRWDHSYMWYQEKGTNPFTMRSLAGKTIPMWIDDPTGSERRANPKAKTRIVANGRTQVLIFRKAAKIGSRKRVAVRDGKGRLLRHKTVPRSYPGAPGRIARTTYHEQYGTHTGKIAKLLPRPHVGVRWRNPGIVGREFMHYSLLEVAQMARVADTTIHSTYGRH
jgi:hypothetical protein